MTRRGGSGLIRYVNELDKLLELLKTIDNVELDKRDRLTMRLIYHTCGAIRGEIRRILGWDRDDRNKEVSNQ